MSLVKTEFDDGVLTIILCDEENRNALSVGLTSELAKTLDEAELNSEVRAIVLTNSGRVFCAGADLSERSANKGVDSSTKPVDPLEIFGRFRKSSKPYIGKIAGHCVAGGMGIAAAMDISIATEEAKFGFTEVRIGVAPAIISVLCLPKMRPSEASETFLRVIVFQLLKLSEWDLLTLQYLLKNLMNLLKKYSLTLKPEVQKRLRLLSN